MELAPPLILNYRRPRPDQRALLALQASWLIAGGVSFIAATIAIFAAAVHFHLPDLLSLYPAFFSLAVLATTLQARVARSLALGAVAGSVFMSTVGYTVCSFWMCRL